MAKIVKSKPDSLIPGYVGTSERLVIRDIEDEESMTYMAEYITKIQRPHSNSRMTVLA
jgi:hypothetical protein